MSDLSAVLQAVDADGGQQRRLSAGTAVLLTAGALAHPGSDGGDAAECAGLARVASSAQQTRSRLGHQRTGQLVATLPHRTQQPTCSIWYD